MTPLEAWNTKAKDYELDELPHPDVFVALAGQIVTRTIQRNGVTIDYITYEHPTLSSLLGNPKHRSKQGHGRPTRYKVARDPNDLGHIFVIDHNAQRKVEVPACRAHTEYATGLRLIEHELILRNARLRKGNDITTAALMRTKAELNEFASAIAKSAKFKTVQRKMARYLEGDRLRAQRSAIESAADDPVDYLSAESGGMYETSAAPRNSVDSVITIRKPSRDMSPTKGHLNEGSDRVQPKLVNDDLSELRATKLWK